MVIKKKKKEEKIQKSTSIFRKTVLYCLHRKKKRSRHGELPTAESPFEALAIRAKTVWKKNTPFEQPLFQKERIVSLP